MIQRPPRSTRVRSSAASQQSKRQILIDTGNLGRVDILERKGSYYVSYIDEENNGASIKLAEINNREIVHTYMIAGVSTSRKTGFPRMINISDGILIAYTNADTEAIEVQKLKLD